MTKKQIIAKVKIFQQLLGMQNWDIRVTFTDFDASLVSEADGYVSIAKTQADPVYMLADICFKPTKLDQIHDGTIIHELVHCIFAEFSSYSDKNVNLRDSLVLYLEEKTVTHLERAFCNFIKK